MVIINVIVINGKDCKQLLFIIKNNTYLHVIYSL